MQTSTSVPPKSLSLVLAHIAAGGRVFVPTYGRVTVIDAKAVARFDRVGIALLRERGDGYQMASGRSSVYLVPGLLKFEGPVRG